MTAMSCLRYYGTLARVVSRRCLTGITWWTMDFCKLFSKRGSSRSREIPNAAVSVAPRSYKLAVAEVSQPLGDAFDNTRITTTTPQDTNTARALIVTIKSVSEKRVFNISGSSHLMNENAIMPIIRMSEAIAKGRVTQCPRRACSALRYRHPA
jgi:hypothetical protein